MTSPVRYLLQSNRTLSLLLIFVMTCVAGDYLFTMTTDMRDRMDMSELGLGMGIFNVPDSVSDTLSYGEHIRLLQLLVSTGCCKMILSAK